MSAGVTSKSPDNLSNDPTWENIDFDALERAASDYVCREWIDESLIQTLPKPTKRRRGILLRVSALTPYRIMPQYIDMTVHQWRKPGNMLIIRRFSCRPKV